MSGAPRFLFLDVETTGLNDYAEVTEVACVVTDDKLNELSHFASAIKPKLPFHQWDPWCVKTFVKNGLMEDLAEAPTPESVASRLLAWLHQTIPNPAKREVEFAGSSVHFDIPHFDGLLEKAYQYDASKLFSHRYFDISALRTAAKLVPEGRVQYAERSAEDAPHRALLDLRIDIEDAKRFLAALA